MATHILALDQGTTSSRAMLFDGAGEVCAVAQREFRQIFPQPGWVEHDAEEIWSSQIGVAEEALARAGVGAEAIAALGIANQRETTVVWDRQSGRPIHHAIVWQDRRTAEFCAQLREEACEETIRAKTGLTLDPYFSGTKLRWLLDHVPEARALAEQGQLAFGTVDSWLLYRLTGGRVHATDATNAARTLLFNIHEGRWDAELLEVFGIPASVLPEVRSCSEVLGETAIDGLPAGLPIAGMAGDQHAALFGQTCFRAGMAKNTYGTGCFLLMQTGTTAIASQNRMLTTLAWQRAGVKEYALEGSVFVAGAVVQWLRDGLGLIRESGEIERLAATVPDNGGVYLVPAFTGLGAPHWDASARGSIVGLTRGSTSGHFARAALEAIAYQSYDVLQAMERDADLRLQELRVDGGAARNDLLMQFQADLLGVPVVRPKQVETTALGAAYLAGLAVRFWPDLAALETQWQIDRRFEPQRSRDEMQALHAQWQRAVKRARSWAQ